MTDLVAIYCRDRKDAGDLRMQTRPAHLEWIKSAPWPIAAAGPLLADDGQTMIGSLFVVKCDDDAGVRAWAENDPYARAGLFESVEVTGFRHLIGSGMGRGAAETSLA